MKTKINLITSWRNPASSYQMVAYNLGILSMASYTHEVKYVLSKLQELYSKLKNDGTPGEMKVTPENLLIDAVVYDILRLGKYDISLWFSWPTINGPREDRSVPNLVSVEIERVHLIKALTDGVYSKLI